MNFFIFEKKNDDKSSNLNMFSQKYTHYTFCSVLVDVLTHTKLRK